MAQRDGSTSPDREPHEAAHHHIAKPERQEDDGARGDPEAFARWAGYGQGHTQEDCIAHTDYAIVHADSNVWVAPGPAFVRTATYLVRRNGGDNAGQSAYTATDGRRTHEHPEEPGRDAHAEGQAAGAEGQLAGEQDFPGQLERHRGGELGGSVGQHKEPEEDRPQEESGCYGDDTEKKQGKKLTNKDVDSKALVKEDQSKVRGTGEQSRHLSFRF